MLNPEVRDVLKYARSALNNREWVQGKMVHRVDAQAVGFCALGSVYHGASRFSIRLRQRAQSALDTYVVSNFPDEEYGSSALYPTEIYNDHPERTKQDVLDLFDRVIAS